MNFRFFVSTQSIDLKLLNLFLISFARLLNFRNYYLIIKFRGQIIIKFIIV